MEKVRYKNKRDLEKTISPKKFNDYLIPLIKKKIITIDGLGPKTLEIAYRLPKVCRYCKRRFLCISDDSFGGKIVRGITPDDVLSDFLGCGEFDPNSDATKIIKDIVGIIGNTYEMYWEGNNWIKAIWELEHNNGKVTIVFKDANIIS